MGMDMGMDTGMDTVNMMDTIPVVGIGFEDTL
jgi:hypothetical protein